MLLKVFNPNHDIYITPPRAHGTLRKRREKECKKMKNGEKSFKMPYSEHVTIIAILNSLQWGLLALSLPIVSHGWRGGELKEP